MVVIRSKIAHRLALIAGLTGLALAILQSAIPVFWGWQAGYKFTGLLSSQILFQFSLIVLNALILFLVILYATAALVTRPLAELEQAAKCLGRGEWGKTTATSHRDELGQLANSFNQMAGQLQNLFTTLKERTASRTRDLQIAADVSRQITTVLDIDLLLQQVVTLTVKGFNLYATSVFLMEEDNLLINVASADASGQMITDQTYISIPLDAKPSIIAKSARQREAITVGDVTQSPAYLPVNALPETRSELVIPMILRDRLLGIFDLQSEIPHRFSQEDLRVLQTLAEQIAVAVRNAQLFAERKRVEERLRELNANLEQSVIDRTQELSALYAVASVASESSGLETTLKRLLERVLTVVNSDAGAIHLLDRSTGALTLAIQQGLPPACVADLETVSMKDNPVSRVLEQGKLLTTDNEADLQVIFPSSPTGLTMYVGLPMRASKQTIGVLSIFPNTVQAQLNTEEVTFLTAIADQAGVVAESARLRRRAKQAAVMEERERLARELHDSVTQSLYSLTLLTEWASDLLGVDRREEVKQRLIEIGKIAQQALKEMRLLLYQLRPAELVQEGLIPALQHRLDAVERRTGVEVQLLADPAIKLSSAVEEGLYRIALEALNNTLKHAAASSVIVQLEAGDNGVTLMVQDNGVGFALDKANGKGRLGLISMRERAKQINAALTIFSEPGQGTTVRVKIDPTDPGHELTKI